MFDREDCGIGFKFSVGFCLEMLLSVSIMDGGCNFHIPHCWNLLSSWVTAAAEVEASEDDLRVLSTSPFTMVIECWSWVAGIIVEEVSRIGRFLERFNVVKYPLHYGI